MASLICILNKIKVQQCFDTVQDTSNKHDMY